MFSFVPACLPVLEDASSWVVGRFVQCSVGSEMMVALSLGMQCSLGGWQCATGWFGWQQLSSYPGRGCISAILDRIVYASALMPQDLVTHDGH